MSRMCCMMFWSNRCLVLPKYIPHMTLIDSNFVAWLGGKANNTAGLPPSSLYTTKLSVVHMRLTKSIHTYIVRQTSNMHGSQFVCERSEHKFKAGGDIGCRCGSSSLHGCSPADQQEKVVHRIGLMDLTPSHIVTAARSFCYGKQVYQ